MLRLRVSSLRLSQRAKYFFWHIFFWELFNQPLLRHLKFMTENLYVPGNAKQPIFLGPQLATAGHNWQAAKKETTKYRLAKNASSLYTAWLLLLLFLYLC